MIKTLTTLTLVIGFLFFTGCSSKEELIKKHTPQRTFDKSKMERDFQQLDREVETLNSNNLK